MNESNINRSSDILEIDLWKLLLLYLRRWILLCALAAAVISLIYTANFITPLYRANVTIYVNNIKANQQVDYISAANLATLSSSSTPMSTSSAAIPCWKRW